MLRYFFVYFLVLLITQTNLAKANEELEKIFQEAQTFSSQEQYDEAIRLFRFMLSINPNLLRPRLELAKNLYLNKDYDTAEHQFSRVLSTVSDVNVQKNILRYIQRIQQELPQINLSIALITDSNPSQKTSEEFINIGGLLFRFVNPEAEKIYGTSLKLNTKIPMKKNFFLKTYFENNNFPGADMDRLYLVNYFGRHIPLSPKTTLTPEIGAHSYFSNSDKVFDGNNIGLKLRNRIDKKSVIEVESKVQEYNYINQARYDGVKKPLSFIYQYNPNSKSNLYISLSNLISKSDDKSLSFINKSLTLGYTQEVNKGFQVGLKARFSNESYEDEHIFFGVKREDKFKNYELSFLNNLFQIEGVAPKLIIGKTVNDSNIPLNAYEKTYTKIEFTTKY